MFVPYSGSVRPVPGSVKSHLFTAGPKGGPVLFATKTHPSTPLVISTVGRSVPNATVGTSLSSVRKALRSSGYARSVSGKGVVQLAKGKRVYTYYPVSKSGRPSMQVKINGKVVLKFRFKGK